MLRRTTVLLIVAGLTGCISGCTIYPDKRPATLASTTSAEQYERLYWTAVKKGNWAQAISMQGPSVVFTTRNGTQVTGEQWVQWLRQNPPTEYLVGEVKVVPQGADTVVCYFASLTDGRSGSEGRSGAPVELAVVSVWQQVGGKLGNLVMVAHSETPRTAPVK